MIAPLATAVEPHPAMIAPFVVLLLAIALMPFVHREWWERRFHLVAVVLGAITILYYAIALRAGDRLLHLAQEYVSFIALIGSLFVVTGGLHLAVKGAARPLGNSLFLLGGAVLANLIGTTGASMLLIRPWLRMNRDRIAAYHVVFFIFLVSNIGGGLTPIGDPPLFLGYLYGVPFWWVAQHCFLPWLCAVGSLLAIFYLLDRRHSRRDSGLDPQGWSLQGKGNLLLLGVIIGAVFLSKPPFLREALMLGAAALSWWKTPRAVHEANAFDWHPLREVAWLFLGIFATMAPALDFLQLHAAQFGPHTEMRFYWLTGILSGLLDNAPTYLTLLAVALGNLGYSLGSPEQLVLFLGSHGRQLVAISLAAVFFGAFTYIGNGPNFMVKAIAERSGVKVPGFFRYITHFAIPILLPVLVLIAILCFSRWRVF